MGSWSIPQKTKQNKKKQVSNSVSDDGGKNLHRTLCSTNSHKGLLSCDWRVGSFPAFLYSIQWIVLPVFFFLYFPVEGAERCKELIYFPLILSDPPGNVGLHRLAGAAAMTVRIRVFGSIARIFVSLYGFGEVELWCRNEDGEKVNTLANHIWPDLLPPPAPAPLTPMLGSEMWDSCLGVNAKVCRLLKWDSCMSFANTWPTYKPLAGFSFLSLWILQRHTFLLKQGHASKQWWAPRAKTY